MEQGGESILVIEDDDNLRLLVGEMLEDAGYQVALSEGPDRAIELAAHRNFDLLLADVRMAGSTDGVGAVQRIKQKQPNVRSVIMTGYADNEVPGRAAAVKADDYLLKGDQNFGMEELLRVVRRTLDAERLHPALAFLRHCFSLSGKLLALPVKLLVDAKLPGLQSAREAFFQDYYILIRSGQLSKEDAFLLWGDLEPLEKRFDALTLPTEIPILQADYEALLGRLRTNKIPAQSYLGPPRHLFYALYEKIRSGRVSLEKLQRAASLRNALEARRQSAESYALYYWLWQEPDIRDRDSFLNLQLGEDKEFTLTKLVRSDEGGTHYQAKRLDSEETYTVEVFPSNEDTESLRSNERYAYNKEFSGYIFLVHRDSDSRRQPQELILKAQHKEAWERSREAHVTQMTDRAGGKKAFEDPLIRLFDDQNVAG